MSDLTTLMLMDQIVEATDRPSIWETASLSVPPVAKQIKRLRAELEAG